MCSSFPHYSYKLECSSFYLAKIHSPPLEQISPLQKGLPQLLVSVEPFIEALPVAPRSARAFRSTKYSFGVPGYSWNFLFLPKSYPIGNRTDTIVLFWAQCVLCPTIYIEKPREGTFRGKTFEKAMILDTHIIVKNNERERHSILQMMMNHNFQT